MAPRLIQLAFTTIKIGVYVGAIFVRFYLLYWIIDMVIGVGLCLVGFFAPMVYVRLTLSPVSAAESYGFLIATVVFAVYVWRTRPGQRLYLFPVTFFVTYVLMGAVFQFSLKHTKPTLIASAQLEAMQTPLYLTAALLCSLAGIALWSWINPGERAAETPDVPSRLRNLREQRRIAAQSKR